MKKIYFTISLSLFAFIGSAQTITGADINPVAGQSFTIHGFSNPSPGPAGANQTWDLSTVVSTGQHTVTNSVSSYVGANIQQVFSTGVTQHVNASSGAFNLVAQIAQGVTIAFSNPWQFFTYPLSLNSTGTDQYQASFTANGINFLRTGTCTFTVDGSGTLLTPSGSFTDVLRIKMEEDFTDASSFGDFEYSRVSYIWVKAGITHWLAYMESTESSIAPTQSGASYTTIQGVSIDKNEAKFSIYPNPCTDVLAINSPNDADFSSIQIVDLQGKTVLMSGAKLIDVQQLQEGVYFVIILDQNNAILSRQKFVKQ